MKQDELNALVRSLKYAGTPVETIGLILKGLLTDVDVTATRGKRAVVTGRLSRLPAEERLQLARKMGTKHLNGNEAKIHWERSARVFPVISKAEARRVLARHGIPVEDKR